MQQLILELLLVLNKITQIDQEIGQMTAILKSIVKIKLKELAAKDKDSIRFHKEIRPIQI